MGQYITSSIAERTYNIIKARLEKEGYGISVIGTLNSIDKNHFEQKFRISYCWTNDGSRKFKISDSAPVLTIRLFNYYFNNETKITYNLSANIPGVFDWEGEDDSLYLLRDVFIDDATSDIINGYADAGYIVAEEVVYESIENSLKRAVNRIYEGLRNEIKENSNEEKDISIEDLNEKIDIIMDALGLKEDDKDEEVADVVDVNLDVNNDSNDNDTLFSTNDDDEIEFTGIETDDTNEDEGEE